MADPNDRDSFRAATRRRFVDDMLGKAREASPQCEWRVMIVDDVTVRVLSSTCGMSDLTAEGVSLVETLGKSREPQSHLEAVYFLTPSAESVSRLCDDWANPPKSAGKKSPATEAPAMYLKAHVFFSSPLPSAQLAAIKKCKPLVECLASLAELNLEYQTRDQRTFVTGQEYALVDFFGGKSPRDKPEWRREADVCATRITTLLASLREMPKIRYKSVGPDGVKGGSVAAAVAEKVHRQTTYLANKSGQSLATTCDVLIVDRSVDPIAPIVHEWTYEAMLFDLCEVNHRNGLFKYKIETNKGTQDKEAVLNEQDPLFCELRHEHIAAVLNKLAEKAKEFSAKGSSSRLTSDSTTGDLKKVVQSLPRFMEAQAKLSTHTSIAAQINSTLNQRNLSNVGRCEEEIIFGEGNSKTIMALLQNFRETAAEMDPNDKLRLLLLYAATHPEKFDDAERARWMKATGLTRVDMDTVTNLEHLGVRVLKKKSSMSGFNKTTKSKRPVVHQRDSEWDLNRFLPTIHHLARAIDAGTLNPMEYPSLGGENEPPPAMSAKSSPMKPSVGAAGGGTAGGGGGVATAKTPGKSARSRPGGGGVHNIDRNRGSFGGDHEAPRFDRAGSANDLPSQGALLPGHRRTASNLSASGASGNNGRRLIVFIVGGVTRGESREAYELSKALGRDVIVGGTEMLKPWDFVNRLAVLGDGRGFAPKKGDDELDLDDIVIDD
uniref:Uncharacterized protein n=1 Tax=Micromonas pusilla TaxID=38833 RepID=A0A7S0KFG8_MICPS|mmetsp:Transcript_12650/g.49288  ORF Transcript_12650/g.49288 Transcript_12650/m.49288 type:complete len:719 (+) Transcript_12650:179-2335(+)